jgi:ribulose-5-phosphate 4-epimerase/fuculose-1-phosphate aldolase
MHMSTSTLSSVQGAVPAPADVDPAEWRVRCDLAAAYQLIDLYGMSDLAANHISARVPGPQDHFLLNPLGVLYDQITASSLIKVDVNGTVIDGAAEQMNPAGFVIHSAVHMARPELTCVLHTHSTAVNGVGATREGLLPINQKAMTIMHFVRYHDFEGAALELGERERILGDLGADGRAVILRNHGSLTVGQSIAEAWVWQYRLETACRFQVAAMACVAGGATLQTLSDEVIAKTREQGRKVLSPGGFMPAGELEWPSLLRKLEKERGADYRT